MSEMIKRIIATLKMLVMVALLSYALLVCWWLLYPYNVIDVYSITIMNPGKKVVQGGTLIYAIDYQKYADIVGTVSKKLINDYTIMYSDSPGMNVPGPRRTEKIPLPVPEYASPGKYRLMWRVSHPVNPMRSIVETAYSDEFEVTPSGTDFNASPMRMENYRQKEVDKQEYFPSTSTKENTYTAKPCPWN